MVDPASPPNIRKATPGDRSALFDICLRTADSGQDATALYSDPMLPGYLWAGAYGALEPNFAFLLTDGDNALGYIIGAPDTAAFEARLDAEWWPMVRRAVEGFVPSRALDAAALARIAEPRDHDDWLAADYPAHLHINLLPGAQSGGWGRRMIDTELEALRQAGARGVHLGVSPLNARAIGFYHHLGFHDIRRDEHLLFGKKLG